MSKRSIGLLTVADIQPWTITPVLGPNLNSVMFAVVLGWIFLGAAFFGEMPHAPDVAGIFTGISCLFFLSAWGMAGKLGKTRDFWLLMLLLSLFFPLPFLMELITGNEFNFVASLGVIAYLLVGQFAVYYGTYYLLFLPISRRSTRRRWEERKRRRQG